MPLAIRRLLGLSVGFRWFWAGQITSVLGDGIRIITLVLWAYSRTHAASTVAYILVAERGSGFLAGLAVAGVVDRVDRRRLMIVCDIGRCFTSGLVFSGLLLNSILLVTLALVVAGTFQVGFQAARTASLPEVVAVNDLSIGNSLMTTTQQAGYMLGPFMGALLFRAAGPLPGVGIDILSFAVSAMLISHIRLPVSAQSTPLTRARTLTLSSFYTRLRDIIVGFWALIKVRPLMLVTLIYILLVFQAGVNGAVLVDFLPMSLHVSSSKIAWFDLGNGAAQVLAGVILIAWIQNHSPALIVTFSTALMTIGSWTLATASYFPIAVAGVVIVALATTPFAVAMSTMQQLLPPEELRGRIIASGSAAGSLSFLLAAIVGGHVADANGVRTALMMSAAAMSLCLLLGACLMGRQRYPLLEPAD